MLEVVNVDDVFKSAIETVAKCKEINLLTNQELLEITEIVIKEVIKPINPEEISAEIKAMINPLTNPLTYVL
jgi:uncharacterized ParB-like nuclease family protein